MDAWGGKGQPTDWLMSPTGTKMNENDDCRDDVSSDFRPQGKFIIPPNQPTTYPTFPFPFHPLDVKIKFSSSFSHWKQN